MELFPKPRKASTIVSLDGLEWQPATFPDYIEELKGLATGIGEACLYRGQQCVSWRLDSKFARWLKQQQGIDLVRRYPKKTLCDVTLQHSLSKEYLHRVYSVPLLRAQLLQNERGLIFEEKRFDLLYHFLVHLQHNPEDENVSQYLPMGTNLLDFTQNPMKGLFFANRHRADDKPGALFVVRQTAMGKALRSGETPLEDAFADWRASLRSPTKAHGVLPSLIWPHNFLNNQLDPKPIRQEAVYVAQWDFRLDHGLIWKRLQWQTGKQIFVKLILPAGTVAEVAQFLHGLDISEPHMFPPTQFDGKPRPLF